MEIRTLLTFIKVAEEQSLSKAAKQLGYAQSTVTMQMQQLEQELGVALYERIGRQIRITQEGHEFLTYAAHIVKTSQEALQIGKGKQKAVSGSLRLGAADSIEEEWLAGALHRYRSRYPDVRIHVRSGDTGRLTQMLLRNEIDLMMTVDHLLNEPALIHACDKIQAVHFAVSPDHPLAGVSSPDLKTILSYPLLRGDLSSVCERNLEAEMAAAGLKPENWMEIENRKLILGMVRYGDGIALMPDDAVQKLADSGQLVQLDYELQGAVLWQQTLYHRNKWLTGAMNAWINMLEEAG